MENNDGNDVVMSRYAFERMQAKEEKESNTKNKIIILLIILLVVTNAMWLVAWNQYDYVDTEDYSVDMQADDGSNANYIGNNGDIHNGSESDSNPETDTEQNAQ